MEESHIDGDQQSMEGVLQGKKKKFRRHMEWKREREDFSNAGLMK